MAGAEDADEPTACVLWYAYTDIADAEAEAQQHEALLRRLGLRGRVRIARQGINATVAGTAEAVEGYVAAVKSDARFADADLKCSSCRQPASRLFASTTVRVVDELVSSDGAFAGLTPNAGGRHVSPEEFDELARRATPLEAAAGAGDGEGDGERGDEESTGASPAARSEGAGGGKGGDERDVVLIDVRNEYEAAIGRFDGATDPQTRCFADMRRWLDEHVEQLRDRRVAMYCTGGVRCELATAYLKGLGHDDVVQLQGGVHRYLERFGDRGRFRGKLFVFDGRVAVAPAELSGEEGDASGASGGSGDSARAGAEVVGRCVHCETPFDELSPARRCAYCRCLVLACGACVRGRPALHCRAHAWCGGSEGELRARLAAAEAALVDERDHDARRALQKRAAALRRALALRGAPAAP